MKQYSIFDIANWFLTKDSVSPKKLEKLTYYAQAWSNALYDQNIISDTNFEAWAHGPVSPELYQKYKNYHWQLIPKLSVEGQNYVDDSEAQDLLESVWITYGDRSANELEALTHTEFPWRNARRGYDPGEHCQVNISQNDMKNFYRSIYTGD